ncbi:phosphoesterase [Candidatus Mycoplasma haemominutum 'Birmingham 1']|uniref:Phosphoesterase n=2 Tax=Candidatus Mycoplasma haematominutum TaxID=209446 RepID=G8C400_9MOLU|nr:phosphoesterase [Candidatus Mycoplasma haematominutum 'Birmingham 1']
MINKYLNRIKSKYSVDLVIANVENAAHGKGVTPKILNQLMQAGVDFFTLGNHSWHKHEFLDSIFHNYSNIVRPLNLSEDFKYHNLGVGTKALKVKDINIRVTNLLGNSVHFRQRQSNCFLCFSSLLDNLSREKKMEEIHLVDLHSETTSEKNAFLWAFNGRVSAVLGTHTHVPTNDAVITEEKTAYISDVGMTGPSCGIIGGERTSIIQKFFYPELKFMLQPQEGAAQFCSVLISFNRENYSPVKIKPIILREGYFFDDYKLHSV